MQTCRQELMFILEERKSFRNHGFINHKKIFAAANAELEKCGGKPKINFNRSTDGLNVENRKMIELTRALSSESGYPDSG